MQLRTLALTLTAALVALIPAWATAQVVPAGPQFQVNTYTTDLQSTPAASGRRWNGPAEGHSPGQRGHPAADRSAADPGTGGGIILNIAGSVYCVGFGNAAAGSVVADTSALWRIVNATGQSCPSP